MQLKGLLAALRQLPPYHALIDTLRDGGILPDQHILRAARPFVAAGLAGDLQRTTLIITARVERAYNVAEQLPVWLPETPILRFTEPGPLFYDRSPWAASTIRSRLAVLAQLVPPVEADKPVPGTAPVIVTSALALMQKTIPIRDFRAASRVLKAGQRTEQDKFLHHLLDIGYVPASVVTEPGTFSRRGGIVDVFPANAEQPVRIEYFGDTIESLRLFDPATQRSSQSVERLAICPAREALPRQSEVVVSKLENWFAQQPSADSDVTSALPDLDGLMSGSAFPLLEFYLPYFYPQPATLLDYLPADTLLIIEDWQAFSDAVAELEGQAIAMRREVQAANSLPPDYPLPYATWDELQESIKAHHALHLGGSSFGDEGDQPEPVALGESDENAENANRLGAYFKPGPRYGGQLRPLIESLQALQDTDERVVLVSNQAMRLAELWQEQNPSEAIAVHENLPDTPEARSESLVFIEGTLAEGWTLRDGYGEGRERPSHLYTDAEIFGWKRPEPRRHHVPRAISPEALFADLAVGDYVVHVEYGIGQFDGLRKRLLDGNEREYLVIRFAGSDMLYVPIHQADRLSRYVGADDSEPQLSRLGGGEWARTKEAARRAAEEVARELLALYASRKAVKGYAFSPDTPWQHELEASFPYIETEDQLRALREVKADMESSTPMDRLICGDLVYGKT